MNPKIVPVLALMLCFLSNSAWAEDPEIEQLRQQLEQLKLEYNNKIEELEKRLRATEIANQQKPVVQQPQAVPENVATAVESAPSDASGSKSFNPDISLILDGRYRSFSQDPESYEIPGFMLGAEAGPGTSGLALGHSELVISANADDKFYGRFTLAFGYHEGETEVEIEEAFFQTLGLNYGLTVRGGRFYSDIGYLNSQHEHQWDFADAPLVYRALFGNHLLDDGLQLSWLAPTDLYLSFGSELFRGSRFPLSTKSGNDVGAYTLYAKTGGDIGDSSSWLAGISYLDADTGNRSSLGTHAHSEEEGEHDPVAFNGDSKTWGVDFVWKWAPNGNRRQRNLQLQYEYYRRKDDGMLTASDESGSYQGDQSGWYAQAVYQFIPRWRVGLRYDALDSSASGSDDELITEAGLDNEGHKPQRFSLMTDWSNSEFSRFRLQYNRDESSPEVENQWILQYILGLGAHGAHQY
ncbi:MAG: hypothetical protein QNL05_03675 [Gammaproteobacteria bacterium]|nr:hypothetical protein [Gammaproteobacteria bacterium]MDX2486660.1 hypothetical protein [Gammaproteobacteria bacterium]